MSISLTEYKKRRSELAKKLSPQSVAIIPAASECLRNGDAHFPFRQDSNFWYLTGFNEPQALLVVFAGEEDNSILFNRERNLAKEQWDGARLGQDDVKNVLGIDKAYPVGEAKERLGEILKKSATVYFPTDSFPQWESLIKSTIADLKKQLRQGVSSPSTWVDVVPLISELRLIKSAAEIEIMRKAASISANAHIRAMKCCLELDNEREIQAELCYEFTRQGCNSVAYNPIVGGAANSCILHYGENDKPLQNDTLLLIDAGGEYQNYAADITRTIPVNGRFNQEQKTVYEWVLKAQRAGIACIKPGVAWNVVQDTMVRILVTGLCSMGILSGDIDKLIADKAYLPYYMHNSGHWLGIDVHDCGAYKVDGSWRLFEPGMVLTVEPGLYLSSAIEGLDPKWHDIGIRIEDDILVTHSGHENLSSAAPVTIADIENKMREKR